MENREPRQYSLALFFLIFIVLAAGIVGAGYVYYRNFRAQFRTEVKSNLSAIADMKIDELARWRAERLSDAGVLFKNPAFSVLVQRALEQPDPTGALNRLKVWLAAIKNAYHYDRVFLLDAQGLERAAAPDTPETVAPHLKETLPDVLRSDQVTFQDFHSDTPDGPVHLSILVPVLADDNPPRSLGVLVLRIDPAQYLYPYLARWPVPSRTAETLIVRREGDEVVYLNELRFNRGPVLSVRFPLSVISLPAVQVVLGHEGIMDGIDYRGIPTVAATRAVPGSPWFLVARVDADEAYAPLRERLFGVALFLGVLLLGIAAAVGLLWRHQRARFYREKLKEADEKRAVLRRNEAILAAVPDIIMEVDDNKVYTWANRAGLLFFGEDVVGKEAAFYFEGEQDTYKTVKPLFNGYEGAIYIESWQRRKDGEKRLFAWWCRGLKDENGRVTGALSSARDITEEKRAEEALALQKRISEIFLTIPGEEMYHEVLKIILEVMESPFGVFGYIDKDGSFMVPSMTRHIWDECQVPQKSIIFRRETWGDSSWPRAIREKKPNYSNELSAKIPEGHVPIQRHISLPILYRGEVIGLFQVANKETDYAEADVRSLGTIAAYVAPILSARLERLRHEQELQAKNDELVRFTYTVSHDLKSPLVTIRTFSGYLEQDLRKPDAVEVDKDLAYIRNAADKASRLLDELLELSRIGRKINPPVEAPLQELVQEALDLVAGRIVERGVTVEVTKDPVLLFGDRTRLVEVFQNLVDNAVKFMGREKAPRVEIGADRVGGETVFFVRDNGIGIDPRYQPKLFGLFEKLDPGSDGTGIGLALVKRIVEVHGGRIWVESEGPGKGTTFRFTLANIQRKPG